MRYARSIVILALLIVPSVAQSKIPGDKIKIGVLQDLPEPYASAAGNGGIVAAQLAASDVEKEYLEGDAEILPDTSEGGIGAELDRVREWIEKEHVAAVVSSANTAVNEQIARMVEARHRTLLITGDGADWTDRPCSPSVIVWGTGRAARIRALAQVSASQNKNRWYLVADQNPSGVASEAASRNALASVGGQVVGTTERVVGSRDFTDTISAVDKTNAELVVTRRQRRRPRQCVAQPSAHSSAASSRVRGTDWDNFRYRSSGSGIGGRAGGDSAILLECG